MVDKSWAAVDINRVQSYIEASLLEDTMKNTYTIQLASKISGVGIHTIRAWEKRYQAVVPERNPSGRREYSEIDVERLVLLSELCVLGHSIGQIARYPTPDLKELLAKIGKLSSKQKLPEAESLDRNLINIPGSLESLLLALRHYKLDIISHEIQKLKIVLTPRELALDILRPLLKEVGTAVANKTLSLPQEQALASLLKFHIGHSLFKARESKNKKPHTIILFTPEGEHYEFGIFMAGLLCAHYGIKFFYLGSNLPLTSVIDATASVEASSLIMGVSPHFQSDDNFLEKYCEKLVRGIEGQAQLLIFGLDSTSQNLAIKNKKLQQFDELKVLDSYLKAL
jgi:MerR family transcriptional regulator, light-induced transcriptional regulator